MNVKVNLIPPQIEVQDADHKALIIVTTAWIIAIIIITLKFNFPIPIPIIFQTNPSKHHVPT